MASKDNSFPHNSALVKCSKVPRFSVDGMCTLYMDVPQDGFRLALSGYNNKTNDTFIDLFMLQNDPGFQDLLYLRTIQPYFSKEFTKIEGSSWRCVCLLDDSVFVTCCFNTIESYDTKHVRLLNRRQFNGKANCMTTTRDGRVYVGLYGSNDVIVFDRTLNQINEIQLKGLRGFPGDITVNKDKLFISTGFNRAALMYNLKTGDIEYEFKEPNHQYREAWSITVSEENGLIYILWSDGGGGKRVVVYCLPGGHSFFSEGYSSLSGCPSLASFNVSDYSSAIRINNNVNRLFVVTNRTGDLYEYHTNDIVNFENLLRLIELLITEGDCQKLLSHCNVPADKAKTIKESDEPSKSLLQHLKEIGIIYDGDISLLLRACIVQGISHVAEAWTNYQTYLSHTKGSLPQLKQTEMKRKHFENITEWENDRQKLNSQLEREEPAERLAAGEEEIQQVSDKLLEPQDERVQLTNRLEKEEEKRRILVDEMKLISEEYQHLKSILNAVENEKGQLSDKLEESDDERQQLIGRLEIAEKERGQLEESLKTTEEEKEQLVTRLEVVEEKKKELTNRLTVSDDETHQLTDRLEKTEKEKRQLEERLEAKVNEEHKLITRLEVIEEENKEMRSRLKTSNDEKQQLSGRLKTLEKEKKECETRLTTTESEKQQLSNRLSATETELQYLYDEKKTFKRIVEEKQQELKEAKSSLRAPKDELFKAHVEYAKESMALEEVLQQTRETLNKKAIRGLTRTQEQTSANSFEEERTSPEEEKDTFGRSEESAALAADYGRLMVDVAEDLTLDNTLRLALLFQLPNSEKDMLRRVSLIETPGITLINIMKTRNIINMYDVTNLQKGLIHLQLHKTNTQYVVPYQKRVDPFLFEENRSDVIDWPDEENESYQASNSSGLQESERTKESEEPQNDRGEERFTENTGRKRKARLRQDSQTMDIVQPYIEHIINDDGGTITLMGVSLSISDKALFGDHVIAVTVIRDSHILLPGSAQRGRMTPLIKLEPEGLTLNKPARLIIPHSAIIPEPDRHSVIIFTGQPAQGESQKGHIAWREENSLKWKLEQETISLDINTLSYVFANLESKEMAQKHIFRVVPFIDGILDAKDDVIITVCFCKDSDLEYQSLIDDYKSKLVFRDFMTFQVSRSLHEDKDGVVDLALTMSPQRDSYYLAEGEATKMVDVDHLCAASRVSLLFRLQRDKRQDDEVVDVNLQVSQGENNQINFIIQSKVKNILLSRESQLALNQGLPKDLLRYETLKKTVSNLLVEKHCEKLATFFELTPAETETVLSDSKPGMELMKILDEREIIMPDKVFGLYQGLKASHLNKIGRHVLEYIDESQKEKVNDKMSAQEDKREAYKRQDSQEKHCQWTSNAKLLIDEGYKRLDVQLALKLSHGDVDLGRILLSVKNEHDKKRKWSLERNYSSCFMQMNNMQIQISRSSGLIGPHISFQKR